MANVVDCPLLHENLVHSSHMWFVGFWCAVCALRSNQKRTHKLSWDLTLIVFYVCYLCFIPFHTSSFWSLCLHFHTLTQTTENLNHMLHSTLHLTIVSRTKRCVIGLRMIPFKKVSTYSGGVFVFYPLKTIDNWAELSSKGTQVTTNIILDYIQ